MRGQFGVWISNLWPATRRLKWLAAVVLRTHFQSRSNERQHVKVASEIRTLSLLRSSKPNLQVLITAFISIYYCSTTFLLVLSRLLIAVKKSIKTANHRLKSSWWCSGTSSPVRRCNTTNTTVTWHRSAQTSTQIAQIDIKRKFQIPKSYDFRARCGKFDSDF